MKIIIFIIKVESEEGKSPLCCFKQSRFVSEVDLGLFTAGINALFNNFRISDS